MREPQLASPPALVGAPERRAPTPPGIARFLFLGSLLAAALVLVLAGVTLWQGRQDTWERAQRASDNLVHSVTGYVDRHMRIYTFALEVVAGALSDPDAAAPSAEAKQRILNTAAASTDYVGNVLEIDAEGNIVRSAHAVPGFTTNLGARDFFTVQRDNPDLGIYVSEPYRSALRGGDPLIAFSRRMTHADGSFAGVIVILVRLAYIEAFFSNINMGPNGALLLLSAQGRIVTRQPPREGQGGIGTDLSHTETFKRMSHANSGSFVAIAAVDGVERFYTFAHIPNQPLIINVAFATKDLFRDWWRRSVVIGMITLATCAVIVVLAAVLRRELYRRALAEADLAFLSITDGLTGLVNRRRFDEVIQREWRRTGRTGASLAMLMIDVDRFKQLNDRHGHARGDEVLKVLARVIGESIRRPGDTAARYGGEEFAVILPDTDNNGAVSIAETIRARSEAGDAGLPPFTVSIGVKAMRPSSGDSLTQFQEDADKALYRAKAEGRNRVVLAA
ncbi:diguanylate cyclase [Xanthobacter sp. DSM 24535]|uniref:sensor domain-containing diguanylate cyclase n=1 Tax=Roseixanthobacter psychrophilus TaxID=3119917 RepID=UPI0037277F65